MTVAEKLRRISEMDYAEIQFRTAQKLRLARERWAVGSNGAGAPATDWRTAWDAAKAENPGLRKALETGNLAACAQRLPAYFAARRAPLFFSRPWYAPLHDWDALRRAYTALLPDRREQICTEAESICAHRFTIFAYPEVEAGREISWRRDLVHGVESRFTHWSRVPYLDFSRVGDSKIVWEPNRHQHFLTLGQAWLLSGEERFAEAALTQFEQWCRANPYPRGINWTSSLEAAFRAWSWLWMIHLMAGSRALTGKRLGNITGALAVHAGYIAENLSTYFSPNTHLLGEGFALYAIGLFLPELHGAAGWRAEGRRILLEQMERQVYFDGAHREQSSCYHRYAAEFFLCGALLADGAGEPFPRPYHERLERMAEFSMHAAWPSGTQPMTGDADGGQLLLLSPRAPNDHRALLSTAAVYFGRGDFARAAGGIHEDTLWLLGPGAAERFARLSPAEPAPRSCVFAHCGAVIQRSEWSPRARYLRFDAGPQGMPPCAHGHADALAILCAADGVEWIVDPGTFVYTSSHQWRDFFRSTRAHATLLVDGRDQATPVDFFKWLKLPSVALERTASLRAFDVAVASHNGYTGVDGVGVHRRSVLFVKPDYWLISDVVDGGGTHLLETRFPFGPGVSLSAEAGRAVAEKSGIRFLVAGDPGWKLRMMSGATSPIEGWFSEDYGARAAAPVLIAERNAELPYRSLWVLWPSPPDSVSVHQTAAPAGWGFRATLATPAFSDQVCFCGTDASPAGDGLWSDAGVALLREDSAGQTLRLAFTDGCCADRHGRPLVRAESWLDEFDLFIENGVFDIHMAPVRTVTLYFPAPSAIRVNGSEAFFEKHDGRVVVRGDS